MTIIIGPFPNPFAIFVQKGNYNCTISNVEVK